MKNSHKTVTFVGSLSGRDISIPSTTVGPMPLLAPPGTIYNGKKADGFGEIDASRGYPDVRSFKRKFGLLIPATNTSMEHELWSVIFKNQGPNGLGGVGLHTANIITPKPQLTNEDDLLAYKKQVLDGLETAVDHVLLADPQYLIMGMSLEHIIAGIDDIRAPMTGVEEYSGLGCATWHDAAQAALERFDAKRIGLLTPFNKEGNLNAARMFNDLGFEVVSSVGFSCANALHIAHVPDWAKEKAIMELLANGDNSLDAVVQCGTNMSLIDVCERLEPVLDIPILGINAVCLWYALRENGFQEPLVGGGRLMREY